MRHNRVEISGSVAWLSDRRTTPAGTPVLSFRLRVEADPDDFAVAACDVHVVSLGELARVQITVGTEVLVVGALTERRWQTPNGARKSRFEILARTVRVL